MANRSFRSRPLDPHKQVQIITDITLLDSTEGLPIKEEDVHVLQPLKEKAAPAHAEKPAVAEKEIPIPGVTRVPTYDLDYLPAFRERYTYLRGKGSNGYEDKTLVEYDLDAEDEAWLSVFNGEQERLDPDKFEKMLWVLDIENGKASDRVYGVGTADRQTAEGCATTDHLQRDEALQHLEENCPSRDTIRVSVYEYWLRKRAKLGCPLLRRLQAPTPPNNTDPYKVFRPREKNNRTQTRRRRQNDIESFQRLQTIQENMRMALQLFELVVKRERKKRDMTYAATDWQQLQIKQRHDPREEQDAIEQEYQNAARSKVVVKRPVGFEKLPEAAPAATNALLDFRNKKNKKRKKLGMEAQLHAVAQLPPPVLPPEPVLVCSSAIQSLTMQFEQGKIELPGVARQGQSVGYRFGRGGRLCIDRCRPFTYEPLVNDSEAELVKPIYELANPYVQWGAKGDAPLKLRLAAPPPMNGTPKDGGEDTMKA